jgi:ankyrin repeat protein
MTSPFKTTPHSGTPGFERHLLMARKGDLSGIKRLLQEDPTLLNAMSGGHNRTLLWEATRRNRVDVVKFLLKRGADVNIPGRHRNESVVLIKPYTVATIFKRAELREMLSAGGTTMDIYTACFLGDQGRVKDLIRKNPSIVNKEQQDETVWRVAPLHHAVSGGHKDLAEFLISKGAQVRPHSELLLEMTGNRDDMLGMLLQHGLDARSVGGVLLASLPEATARLLIKNGADVNKQAWGQWPPIAYLSRGDKGEHADRVQALISYGADLHARAPNGVTAVHAAAKAGFVSVLEVLLHHGADVNARTEDGFTPLSLAMASGRDDACRFLRKHGGKT